MAKPGELAGLIAELFGAEVPTVRAQARELRDHDYMAKEKGGRGSGSMTARDAAHLLVAAAGTNSVRKSVDVIHRPGQFISRAGKWKLAFLPIPEMIELPSNHTLIDAVEALIRAGIDGTLQEEANKVSGAAVDLVHDLAPDTQIEVSLVGPMPSAAIKIGLLTRGEHGEPIEDTDAQELHRYGGIERRGNLSGIDIATRDELEIDLRSEFRFTHRSIMRIARLLDGAV
ncbi:hypothetical protein [Aerobium aerolatum]|uniref:Uncharacterized protein n=1 Tax=Aquamicrobium aerolatum DSM 21857 TaxID=1121003 RepID=A0A1I3JH04_9HYPH|nr:hypothetical protein [Aquamicrobium aerolatum]SFI59519.1 hypothetical protein SAMN03080618_00853 [Aquamicrobium aerolatum DSM 21857]